MLKLLLALAILLALACLANEVIALAARLHALDAARPCAPACKTGGLCP